MSATDVRDLWVDMHTTFDANYGKSIPSATNSFPCIPLLVRFVTVIADPGESSTEDNDESLAQKGLPRLG
jgi:hypothetical protein